MPRRDGENLTYLCGRKPVVRKDLAEKVKLELRIKEIEAEGRIRISESDQVGESHSRFRKSTYREQRTGVAGSCSFKELGVSTAGIQGTCPVEMRKDMPGTHAELKNRMLSLEVCICVWKHLRVLKDIKQQSE